MLPGEFNLHSENSSSTFVIQAPAGRMEDKDSSLLMPPSHQSLSNHSPNKSVCGGEGSHSKPYCCRQMHAHCKQKKNSKRRTSVNFEFALPKSTHRPLYIFLESSEHTGKYVYTFLKKPTKVICIVFSFHNTFLKYLP